MPSHRVEYFELRGLPAKSPSVEAQPRICRHLLKALLPCWSWLSDSEDHVLSAVAHGLREGERDGGYGKPDSRAVAAAACEQRASLPQPKREGGHEERGKKKKKKTSRSYHNMGAHVVECRCRGETANRLF